MRNIWRIIALLAIVGICLALAGLVAGANTNGLYIDKNGLNIHSGEYTPIKESNIGVISDIKIDASSIEIRFIKADDYGFEIYCKDGSNVSYFYDNSRLVIEQRNSFSFFNVGFNWEREYINVYLPEDAILDSVDIKNISGKINADRLNSKTLYVKQSSGNTEINNLEAGDVTIKNTSGKISINNGKADSFDITLSSGNLIASELEANRFKAEVTSGNVDLSGTFAGNTELKVSSGKTSMRINGSEKDYNRNIRVSSGKVMINGKETVGDTVVNFNADNNLDIKTTSGNIDITFQK